MPHAYATKQSYYQLDKALQFILSRIKNKMFHSGSK